MTSTAFSRSSFSTRPALRPAAVLRARQATQAALEIRAHLRRLVRAIRAHCTHAHLDPGGQPLHEPPCDRLVPRQRDRLRAGGLAPSAAAAPSVVEMLGASTHARFEASTKTAKIRRFKDLYHAAGSWTRAERVVARVEVGPQGADTRFVVTSLAGVRAKTIYEEVYCARGQAENHIKAFRPISPRIAPPDEGHREPVPAVPATAGAYWLLWSPARRSAAAARALARFAQFDTLRLRVIQRSPPACPRDEAQIRISLRSACPDEPLMRLLLQLIPRLVT